MAIQDQPYATVKKHMGQAGFTQICPNCKTINAANDQFCVNCGYALDSGSITVPSTPPKAAAQNTGRRMTGALQSGR